MWATKWYGIFFMYLYLGNDVELPKCSNVSIERRKYVWFYLKPLWELIVVHFYFQILWHALYLTTIYFSLMAIFLRQFGMTHLAKDIGHFRPGLVRLVDGNQLHGFGVIQIHCTRDIFAGVRLKHHVHLQDASLDSNTFVTLQYFLYLTLNLFLVSLNLLKAEAIHHINGGYVTVRSGRFKVKSC